MSVGPPEGRRAGWSRVVFFFFPRSTAAWNGKCQQSQDPHRDDSKMLKYNFGVNYPFTLISSIPARFIWEEASTVWNQFFKHQNKA